MEGPPSAQRRWVSGFRGVLPCLVGRPWRFVDPPMAPPPRCTVVPAERAACRPHHHRTCTTCEARDGNAPGAPAGRRTLSGPTTETDRGLWTRNGIETGRVGPGHVLFGCRHCGPEGHAQPQKGRHTGVPVTHEHVGVRGGVAEMCRRPLGQRPSCGPMSPPPPPRPQHP